ncbi:MAG: hypothetical protein PHW04_08315 [Candidatus Wallbacteria bacterium]|nr:hypothetical protein [Candidatus Wallbacteria bacterium]
MKNLLIISFLFLSFTLTAQVKSDLTTAVSNENTIKELQLKISILVSELIRLEARIQTLEIEVSELKNNSVNKKDPASLLKLRTLWETLTKGMTEKEVKKILGDPEKITKSELISPKFKYTVWDYEYFNHAHDGRCTFLDGKLDSWTSP